MKAIDSVLAPIHREGHIFVAVFSVVSSLLYWLYEPLGLAGLVLTAWCLYFFRDPERVVPDRADIAVSPADGTVSYVGYGVPPSELEMGREERARISIFLNVFNVHVNRMPIEGRVEKLVHVSGQFLNAADPEASEKNERQLVHLVGNDGQDMAVIQVAGLVARRILCYLEEGQQVGRGERYGLIRFGSRMDIYLPKTMEAIVLPGQTMVAGETVIGIKKD